MKSNIFPRHHLTALPNNMPIYSSDFDSDHQTIASRLFGRERSMHALLGGGRVADVLLWRNKNVSAAILIGMTLLWFLFEVVEYHFLTLVCYISITAMLIIFIWSNGAALFDRRPPRIPEIILSESAFHRAASTFYSEFNRLLFLLYDIACGKDLTLFILVFHSISLTLLILSFTFIFNQTYFVAYIFFHAIVFLWTLSAIGNYFSSFNLFYLGFIGIGTLPVLYERYQNEVDYVAGRRNKDLKKLYKKFDTKVLSKVPKGPVKEKKYK